MLLLLWLWDRCGNIPKYPESPLNNPVVSEVASTETGETFFLLHNEGEGGATKLEIL